MAEPIEANYVPEGDDWTVTVSGRGKKLTATAPGIIAARDRTDQLVEQLAPDEEYRTVVHLLNGDAVQFTTAYLTARLTITEPAATRATSTDGEQPAEPDGNPAKTPRSREADPAT